MPSPHHRLPLKVLVRKSEVPQPRLPTAAQPVAEEPVGKILARRRARGVRRRRHAQLVRPRRFPPRPEYAARLGGERPEGSLLERCQRDTRRIRSRAARDPDPVALEVVEGTALRASGRSHHTESDRQRGGGQEQAPDPGRSCTLRPARALPVAGTRHGCGGDRRANVHIAERATPTLRGLWSSVVVSFGPSVS